MSGATNSPDPRLGGIYISLSTSRDMEAARLNVMDQLGALGLDQYVKAADETDGDRFGARFRLREEFAGKWAPDSDTIQLCESLQLDTLGKSGDLEREILLAMLLSPVAFEFPGHQALTSAVRIRKNIVEAARRTVLAFDTSEAERPEDYWAYAKGRGFTILPGKSLIEALQKATQPGVSDELYSFSCYRATEYVILLGIAQELTTCNPELFCQLQRQWESRAIMSAEFHAVFLREYGSMSEPLPVKYYVPGDRLWFRNPDDSSSDVTGYEGSWVFYLGGGLFTNFWKRGTPYTLTSKCLELFHWRHATYRNEAGKLQIDEEKVEALVQSSMNDPAEVERILKIMLRLREPTGVYVDGGCIDTSREYPRCVCPGVPGMALPGH